MPAGDVPALCLRVSTVSDELRWPPSQTSQVAPDPPPHAALDVQQLQSEVLPDHCAPPGVVASERPASPRRKPQSTRQCPRSHLELVTIREGQDDNWLLKHWLDSTEASNTRDKRLKQSELTELVAYNWAKRTAGLRFLNNELQQGVVIFCWFWRRLWQKVGVFLPLKWQNIMSKIPSCVWPAPLHQKNLIERANHTHIQPQQDTFADSQTVHWKEQLDTRVLSSPAVSK